ncbi:MAG TPA: DegV family protein [Acidimicrobiia bacterium]
MTTALVTDSGAQLPDALRDRYHVHVVPLTVVLDGEAHREGVDLTTSEFYERLESGAEVTTAAPAPGEVLAVYEAAAAAGATEILSVHIGSNTSGTIGAVKLAVSDSPVPVEVVDTGTASFAVACCVWAAGDVLAAGRPLAAAADAARTTAGEVGNVFIVGALDLARRGGRLAAGVDDAGGLPVLALTGGEMRAVGRVTDVDAAMTAMTELVRASAEGRAQRVGVGDAVAAELAGELEARLRALPEVVEIVRYDIGPSVGSHTGPGTVGACFFPA